MRIQSGFTRCNCYISLLSLRAVPPPLPYFCLTLFFMTLDPLESIVQLSYRILYILESSVSSVFNGKKKSSKDTFRIKYICLYSMFYCFKILYFRFQGNLAQCISYSLQSYPLPILNDYHQWLFSIHRTLRILEGVYDVTTKINIYCK